MHTLSEIQAAITKLAPNELFELRDWLEEFCEEKLALSGAVKADLDKAHQDITTGRFRTRHAT
ncbi:hypothetical protein LBMAG56_31720 [Verrucomicrobiota bacterium]|nr:hypothetical protein LBMAG56_31720 [Verrucomicrobiota bacterium]